MGIGQEFLDFVDTRILTLSLSLSLVEMFVSIARSAPGGEYVQYEKNEKINNTSILFPFARFHPQVEDHAGKKEVIFAAAFD